MGEPNRGFFTLNPRRKSTNLLLQPALQLRLPLYLLLLTFAAGMLLGVHTYLSYERLFAVAVEHTENPVHFEQIFGAQTADFLVGVGAMGLVYVLALVVLSIAYLHKLVGPTVPLRRQLEALKNGDYSARVKLREGDALQDVARDLNELAEVLEGGGREKPPTG